MSNKYFKSLVSCVGLFVIAASAFAQPATSGSGQNKYQTQSSSGVNSSGTKSMPDFTGQLPPELLAQLSLTKDQENKLDAAQIARHSMWVANRRERQKEYQLIAKELEADKFEPRDIIKLRKTIRQDADKRMDDVQNAWLEFWDGLNESQRKLLVSYMKTQHRILGKAPDPSTSTTKTSK